MKKKENAKNRPKVPNDKPTETVEADDDEESDEQNYAEQDEIAVEEKKRKPNEDNQEVGDDHQTDDKETEVVSSCAVKIVDSEESEEIQSADIAGCAENPIPFPLIFLQNFNNFFLHFIINICVLNP